MRGVERAADLRGILERLVERQRAFERRPFDILEHEVAFAVVPADVVECADVRVIQRRDRARLAFEALAERPAGLPQLADSASAKGGKNLVRAGRAPEMRAKRPCRRLYGL